MSDDRKTGLVDAKYGDLKDVTYFDHRGCGPSHADFYLRANIHPDPNYPRQRIAFGQVRSDGIDFGGILMDVETANKLIAMLQSAVRDVIKNVPSVTMAVFDLSDEGH